MKIEIEQKKNARTQIAKDPKFFHYRQTNSGGSFVIDDERGIGPHVWVEAHSADEANKLAEDLGLYFDGAGDCDCCGNRWSEAWREDGQTQAEIEEVLEEDDNDIDLQYYSGWHNKVYIHTLDGQLIKIVLEPVGKVWNDDKRRFERVDR